MVSSLDARGIYARNNHGAIVRLAFSGKSGFHDRYSTLTMRAVTDVTASGLTLWLAVQHSRLMKVFVFDLLAYGDIWII
jgi:hypothetical protein